MPALMNDTDTLGDATDRMLLRRMAAGDRDALASMYQNYHSRLCRFLSRLTRRPDIIEEAINDCFWIAWQKAGDFRGDSQVSTWIMGIAYRCGLKCLRQHDGEAIDDTAVVEDHAPAPTTTTTANCATGWTRAWNDCRRSSAW